jgi:hypothetical protein
LASIGQTVLKLSHLLCFSLLPFYGWENDEWQNSNAARIQDNSVLSKMTVRSRYLKQFKHYSIFKCWPSEIEDGGRRPKKWRNFSTSLGRSISIVKTQEVYFCQTGCFVAFVISSQYISLHPYRHTSVDSITQFHSW